MGAGGGMGPGGGVGAAGGAGQPGKRRPAGGNGFVDTGGDMGIGSSGGGFAGNNRGGGNRGSGFGSSSGSKSVWDSGSSSGSKPKETEAGVNMDSEAPIPGEPQLYSEGDVFHVARVTFTVKLVDEKTTEPGV